MQGNQSRSCVDYTFHLRNVVVGVSNSSMSTITGAYIFILCICLFKTEHLHKDIFEKRLKE